MKSLGVLRISFSFSPVIYGRAISERQLLFFFCHLQRFIERQLLKFFLWQLSSFLLVKRRKGSDEKGRKISSSRVGGSLGLSHASLTWQEEEPRR